MILWKRPDIALFAINMEVVGVDKLTFVHEAKLASEELFV